LARALQPITPSFVREVSLGSALDLLPGFLTAGLTRVQCLNLRIDVHHRWIYKNFIQERYARFVNNFNAREVQLTVPERLVPAISCFLSSVYHLHTVIVETGKPTLEAKKVELLNVVLASRPQLRRLVLTNHRVRLTVFDK
jgi:hypothetical protein